MRKFSSSIIVFSFILTSVGTVFGDYRIRQQISMGDDKDGAVMDRSVWIKGQRERTQTKFIVDGQDMSAMMPTLTEVMQCDLRQMIKINDASKRFMIEAFIDSDNKPLPSVEPSTKVTVRKGGNVTWTYTLIDSGERKEMFGFTARKLTVKQLVEASKNSCNGESRMNIVEEGWFAYIIPESARCDVQLPRGEGEEQDECRDTMIRKGSFQYPGMMLEGTMTYTDLIKNSVSKQTVKTLDVSKETLAISLFEPPPGYTEVNSLQSLMSRGKVDMVAKMTADATSGKSIGKKPVGIDFFAGNVSKINQNAMRQYLADKFASNGQNATLVVSQNDLTSGAYMAIVGVQIKNIKESGAAKIGGLFGKVTGADDASKIGESEAELVITAYAADGKTVLATGNAKQKVSGKAEDAVKAAIDNAFSQIASKVK